MKICMVPWCNTEANGAKGYCRTHYTQMSKHGKIRPKKENTCKVQDCESKPIAKGFCYRHYNQFINNGKIKTTIHDIFKKQKIKVLKNNCFITISKKDGSFVICIVDKEDYILVKDHKFYIGNKNYVNISKHKKFRFLHQLICNSKWVDHIDHNLLNNKRNNLRKCTPQQNTFNRAPLTNQKGSNYKGVNRGGRAKKYTAIIWKNKKRISLGSFATEEEAAIAYNNAAKKLFGEFAYLNIIKGEHTCCS